MSKLSAEPIMTQMTIWDLMKESLDDLTSEQMVSRIGDRTGLNFSPIKDFKWLDEPYFVAKYRKGTIEVNYSQYETLDERNGKRFISAGWTYSKGGGGGPYDSVDEAVKAIEGFKRRLDENIS